MVDNIDFSVILCEYVVVVIGVFERRVCISFCIFE